MSLQQLVLGVHCLRFLIFRDDMGYRSHVDDGGLWRSNRRIIFGQEELVGAVFHCLWWLHRILRLKGLVVFVVRDDVTRKYVRLIGFLPFQRCAESAKGASTGSRGSQAHVGGWVQRDGLSELSLGPKKRYVLACRYCSSLGVSLNPSGLAVYFCGRLDEVSLIIGDARRSAIIEHERPRARVELSTRRCVRRTICPGCSHDGNGVVMQSVPRDFLVPGTSGFRATMTLSTTSAAHFYPCYRVKQRLCTSPHGFKHRFDPHTLRGSTPL